MKLIDADELRKKIARERGAWEAVDAWVTAIDQALYVVDSMPAAEANQAPGPDWKAKLREDVLMSGLPGFAVIEMQRLIDALPDPPTPDPDAPPLYVPPEGHYAPVLGRDVPDGWEGRYASSYAWWNGADCRCSPDILFEVRRVPAPEPATEWVPLTKLVGRTIKGEVEPVAGFQIWDRGPSWWAKGGEEWLPLPTRDDGMVEVLAEGER